MHHRILSWLFCGAIALAVSLRAQGPATPAPAAAGGAMPPGLVLVAKFDGQVQMTVDGKMTLLKVDDPVPQNAKINTLKESSVVLVFSNGATTRLGPESELIMEEFLQDPFSSVQKVADMKDEPSRSRTRLRLNRGELVGEVKHLKDPNDPNGSKFTVQTPVGAAGIRGTIFQIVFKPGPNGAIFQLSTALGEVAFNQSALGGGTPGGGTPGGGTPPAGGGNVVIKTAEASGVTGLSVPQGQEVSFTVEATTNPVTGQISVTVVPTQATKTANVDPQVMAQVTNTATAIAAAVQQTVFTPAPASTGTGGTGTGGTGTGTGGATLGGTTTGTTTTTISTSADGKTTTTTTTTPVTGQNFTGTITGTTTTSPLPTQSQPLTESQIGTGP